MMLIFDFVSIAAAAGTSRGPMGGKQEMAENDGPIERPTP